jgi:hypothetical protein
LVENAERKEEVAVIEDAEPSEEGEFQDASSLPVVQISMHALLVLLLKPLPLH